MGQGHLIYLPNRKHATPIQPLSLTVPLHMKPSPKLTICIMADFGMAAYAWFRELNKTHGIGDNIADAVIALPDEFGVSKALQSELGEWAIIFENKCPEPTFDWEGWNAKGLSLAKRLKQEVGDKYLVEYHYPMEDPRFKDDWPVVLIDFNGEEHIRP